MRKVNIQKYLLQAPGIEMTTKVTKKTFPRRTPISTEVSLTTNSLQRSMCQATSDKSTQLESCYISLQAVTLHPQQRYLSHANISQQSPCFPQQQYPDLELGQIVHRRKPTPSIFPSQKFRRIPDSSNP